MIIRDFFFGKKESHVSIGVISTFGLKTFYLSGLADIDFGFNFYRKISLTFSPTLNFAIDPINKNVPVVSYPEVDQ